MIYDKKKQFTYLIRYKIDQLHSEPQYSQMNKNFS